MYFSIFKYFNRGFLKINLLFIAIGSAIGLVICIFESAINEQLVSFQRFASYQIFSILMTVCVTDLVYLYECTRKTKKKTLLHFILLYNLGLIAGTELSYLVLSAAFHVPYNFKNHAGCCNLFLQGAAGGNEC
jgi:two-component system, LytTR family, sensor kinase